MADAKTRPTALAPAAFIAKVADAGRRADAAALLRIFERATGEKAVMWGPSIIGFGTYHYRYESGREGDMCLAGFSPRASALVLYVLSKADGEADRLARLGKHKLGKGCLYIARLADVDTAGLEDLVRVSAAHTRERQQCDICVDSRAEAKQAKAASSRARTSASPRASSARTKARRRR
jgi:hypothetical protein